MPRGPVFQKGKPQRQGISHQVPDDRFCLAGTSLFTKFIYLSLKSLSRLSQDLKQNEAHSLPTAGGTEQPCRRKSWRQN